MLNAAIGMLLTSSWSGTAPSRGSHSTEPLYSDTGFISNHVNSRRAPSICDLARCVDWRTRRLIRGLLSADLAAGIRRVKGLKKIGVRLGNWLLPDQAIALLEAPDPETMKGKRDLALLAILVACGLRRHEAVELNVSDLQQREDHWAIVDLIGKASHIRTIPVPDWVKNLIGDWLQSAGISNGRIFRRVTRAGTVWGSGLSEKVVWHVVRQYARKAGIEKLAPHDLRRTCARLCHQAGGELDQIQFLLGHVSVQTTERYLGCKQRIRNAVNDRIGIQPKGRTSSDP
jgi:site-specific recombinase XerD